MIDEHRDPARDSGTGRPTGRRRLVGRYLARVSSLAVLACVLVLLLHLVIATPSTSTTTTTLPAPSTVLSVGERAPERLALDLLGTDRKVVLARLLSGHASVLNFFASWCTACATEMSTFAAEAKTAGGGVVFVGIDTNETDPAKARAILKGAGVDYAVATDTAGLAAALAYGIVDLPTTFFVSATGRITAEVLGVESAASLRHEVDRLRHPA